jgi:hypothetical protein
MIFDRQGNWAVMQQGMSAATGYARRYQWRSDGLAHFVEEPHTGLIGTPANDVLDMTSDESNGARAASVDLVKEGIERLERQVVVVEKGQSTLSEWMGENPIKLHMPRDINWTTLRHAYEFQPRNYEELISLEGIGPSTVRALALISELIYGTRASWKDPVKFSFAVGGKDGVPYPVDREAMDHSIELLNTGIEESRISNREKLDAIGRLRRLVPPDL